MTRWLVCPAAAIDACAVADLEARIFGSTSWGRKSVIDGLSAAAVSSIIVRPSASAPAIGFAMWRNLGIEGEILSIGVATDARRAGAGRALLGEIIAKATTAGLEAIFLEVDSSNAAAKALYESNGFETVGQRLDYYKNGADALVMRRTLVRL